MRSQICRRSRTALAAGAPLASGTKRWRRSAPWCRYAYIYVYPCDSFTLNFAKTGSGRTHNGKKGAVFFQPVATDLVTDSATDLATSCHVPRDTSTALS
jgi:hypothetical protein